LIVFYLKQIGLAWTWFIGISIVVFGLITTLIERIMSSYDHR